MSDKAYLVLWLEGPLQAWGADSRFYRRETLTFPTRSGVLGLLCCAMGAGGEQREWLQKMKPYSQSVYAYQKGRRRIPVLADFQMVGSGYDDADPWQRLLIPKTTAGKKAVGGGTKMTCRSYLQDVAFGVVVAVPEELLSAICNGLENPVWDLYLGRKTCTPTDLIYRGYYGSESEAVDVIADIARAKELCPSFIVRDGGFPDEGDVSVLNDVPICFGTRKVYEDRTVTVMYPENE